MSPASNLPSLAPEPSAITTRPMTAGGGAPYWIQKGMARGVRQFFLRELLTMNGGSGTSRGRGWTRGARGRGRQNQSFRLAYDGRGLQQTPFPRPLGRGRGGEPRPFQPNPVTSHVPRCPGRGRGLRQPPLMAAPSLPLHHPPPQPHTPQRRHSASHWQELWPTAGSLPRGNPLHRPWERVSDPERVGQAPPTTLCVMTYNVLAQSLVGGNM